MVIALTVLHVLMCFAIIGIVLLQAGKGADIGSAFGGAGSQAVFGSMGTPTLLGKITTGVALLFTITSFTLASWAASAPPRWCASPRRWVRRRPPRRRRRRALGALRDPSAVGPKSAPAPPSAPATK